ncbi:hypothetical protein [Pseudomonas sp. ANT_J28]|uniref:hypothetical protein n=1 Tax=Pseudomonas sp. ANT_J28 TaxID=2597352 RepID=UPI0011F0B47D|nr:hypothetical protein [Pseudomonas sp. ANT_J28]KAA0981060.1 hypothetical protein FQ187_21530 [Pseudomonas sp. ANT_J28]
MKNRWVLQTFPNDLLWPEARKKGAPAWENVLPDPHFIDLGEVAGRDWDVPYEIPLSFMSEDTTPETPTEYEFRYRLYAGGSNESISTPIITYAIDRTPPYKIKSPASDLTPKAPTWPADLGPNDPIDETYLEGKPGILVKPAVSPTYHQSDIYRFYWGPAPDPDRDTPVFEGALTAGEALIPAAVFKKDEGTNRLIYVASDLPGNRGKRSNPSQRTVVILPDPSVILPPVLPLANGPSGDGLIDLADTQFDSKGVEIKVTVPTPNSESDTIVVYWGGKPIAPEQRVGTNTELSFFASYDLVKEVYGNTDGSVVTEVSYKMFRSTREIATHKANVNVDVSFVGPDPILVGLDAPKLETSAGRIDEILEADYGDTGINITIDLFAAPPTEEGWLIDVFYDDVKIGNTILLTTGQEGKPLTIPLPWATVLAQQSGTKVLRYTLYTLTGVNPTPSKKKDIPVEAFPITMAAPEVMYLGGLLRNISCPTLNFPVIGNPGDGTPRRNLTVRVRKNPYTVDGETITVKWVPYDTATIPAPIPDADTTATYPIVGTYPDTGALIEIGVYATHFKPAHLGKGRVTYSISRGGAGNNPTPDSLPAEHVVFLTDNQGKYCEETLPQD